MSSTSEAADEDKGAGAGPDGGGDGPDGGGGGPDGGGGGPDGGGGGPDGGGGGPDGSESESTEAVEVTPEAAEQAISLLESEDMDTDVAGLRLFVQQGGCAGLSYGMRFDHESDEDDIVTEHHGLRVFVDPASLNYVSGSVLDFEGGLQGAGFHVENPNVVSECGCGESFRT